MQRSEHIGNLVAALAKARAKFKAIGRDREAKIQSQKGAFSYRYADLATAIEATADGLAASELVVMQPSRLDGNAVVVTTVLAHSSGEWISEEMTWPVAGNDNRSIGSGITYARRNGYLAILGVAAQDEDDDAEQARGGNHEMQRPEQEQKREYPPAPESDISRKLRADLGKLIDTLPDALHKAKAKEKLGRIGHNTNLLGELEQWVRKHLPEQKGGAA